MNWMYNWLNNPNNWSVQVTNSQYAIQYEKSGELYTYKSCVLFMSREMAIDYFKYCWPGKFDKIVCTFRLKR